MRNISVKLVEFEPVVQEEMSFLPSCSAERNRLGNLAECIRKNILNLNRWFRRRCRFNIVLI